MVNYGFYAVLMSGFGLLNVLLDFPLGKPSPAQQLLIDAIGLPVFIIMLVGGAALFLFGMTRKEEGNSEVALQERGNDDSSSRPSKS